MGSRVEQKDPASLALVKESLSFAEAGGYCTATTNPRHDSS